MSPSNEAQHRLGFRGPVVRSPLGQRPPLPRAHSQGRLAVKSSAHFDATCAGGIRITRFMATAACPDISTDEPRLTIDRIRAWCLLRTAAGRRWKTQSSAVHVITSCPISTILTNKIAGACATAYIPTGVSNTYTAVTTSTRFARCTISSTHTSQAREPRLTTESAHLILHVGALGFACPKECLEREATVRIRVDAHLPLGALRRKRIAQLSAQTSLLLRNRRTIGTPETRATVAPTQAARFTTIELAETPPTLMTRQTLAGGASLACRDRLRFVWQAIRFASRPSKHVAPVPGRTVTTEN